MLFTGTGALGALEQTVKVIKGSVRCHIEQIVDVPVPTKPGAER